LPAFVKKTSFRYFAGYLSILVIPIIVSVIAFITIQNRFHEELEKYGFSILDHIQASIDEKLNRVGQESMDYAMDLRITNFSKLGAQLDEYDIEALVRAQSLLDRAKVSGNNVSDAFLINYSGGYVLTTSGKTDLTEYFDRNRFSQSDGGNNWDALLSGFPYFGFFIVNNLTDLKQYIVLTRPVPVMAGRMEDCKAALVFFIDADVIREEFSRLADFKYSSFYLVNEQNIAIIGTDGEWDPDTYILEGSAGVFESSSGGVLYYTTSEHCPWSYVWLTSIDSISANLDVVKAVMAYSLLAAVALGLVLSMVLTRSNLLSVTDIIRLIRSQPETKQRARTEEFENIRQGISILMQSSQAMAGELDRQKSFLKSSVVAQLMLDVLESYENLDKILEWSGIDFPNGHFLTAILSIDGSGSDFLGHDTLLSVGIQNIVTEIAGECGTVYTCQLSRGAICALINTDSDPKDVERLLELACGECAKYLKALVRVYMGGLACSVSGIAKSFEQARRRHDEKADRNRTQVLDVRYSQIDQYIREHYGEINLSLEQVASAFGISPPYLSSLFKKSNGESFLVYLRHVRVGKATELLKTNKTLEQIAAEVGYVNANILIRNFKKDVGMTPGQYRLQVPYIPDKNQP